MILAKEAGGGQRKIVIVEDEEILVELLRDKLEKAGFSVSVARDGAAGFDLIRDTHPDLVLLDMMLPGMDGFGVLERMKDAGLLPATPVLVISNSGQPIETERARDLGVRDFLLKVNFDPREVLARVEALLGTKKDRGAPEAGISGRDGTPRGAILIIEDDLLLQELLERRFAQEGYRPVRALDAEQARRILETMAPDCILLDLVLPDTDGFVFLEELKRDKKIARVPVVVISNLGQREEIEKGLAMGAVDYVVKAHISPGEIVKKVEELLISRDMNHARRIGK
ncbi:MAG: response regulator [Patescibacteria group bacterium]